ncbi:MAG: hypothetical protein OXF02_03040 [Simkaniaceae bacterium]|nr:hypothetical protein [Simkaniaceae bacterium]
MRRALLVVACSVSLLCGCETKTVGGALAGGALGAGVGGIAGGGTGALVGGATGVIAGGLIGAALDESDRGSLQRESPETYGRIERGEPLNVEDVIRLNQAQFDDDKIIGLIRDTRSYFRLTYAQVSRLREAGVSERVIGYMLSRR